MTSGTDLSTSSPDNSGMPAPLAAPADGGDTGEPSVPPAPEDLAGVGPVVRALRTAGFHLVVLGAFTVPAIVLWWDVWTGHPSASLTCGCGDPAQEVWFMAWPAWAIAHLHSLFFSGAVNVPDGANLLSNTSGTLVGVVLAPVTWAFGPIVATNVALTLAPGLSAWGCFAAVRPLVSWKAGAIPAALVYGYSAAIVSSLAFGHVSVTVLVFPPLLFTTLHEIVIRQEHDARRDGIVLAALLVAQFLISPEVFVMCLIFGAVGLVAVVVVGWRQVRRRAGHALAALALGGGITVLVLAYPVWFGLAGPQAVTGVLFSLAPLAGVPLSGLLAPGMYGAPANAYVRFGGYLGRIGPPPDYLGAGSALAVVGAIVVGRRRPLTWLLVFLAVVGFVLALGLRITGGPEWSLHVWLPWRALRHLPLLQEILPDQFAPFVPLFVAFLLAVGLDALFVSSWQPRSWSWPATHRLAITGAATAVVAVLALVPVFVTFDLPLKVVPVGVPPYFREVAPALPSDTVLLTVPFAVSGSSEPMLWQAAEGMPFRLAGAALKTPDASGGPVGSGPPGSARRILTDLTVAGADEPTGTGLQVATVRRALRDWRVGRVVITGPSRDPVYASGFFTMVLGVAPRYEQGAWVWTVQPGGPSSAPALGPDLAPCRVAARAPNQRDKPLAMSQCVLFTAGRP